MLVLLAPIAADRFDEPRLEWVIRLLAVRALIQGAENIGMVDFQRRLDFRRDVQIGLLTKGAGFLTTIGLAYVLRSYWALIAGTIVGPPSLSC